MLAVGQAKNFELIKEQQKMSYGQLTEFNQSGLIHNSVDKDILIEIASDYLNLLESSTAIYEKNGDYVLGIISSGWCRLLDDASRKLCQTDDNQVALQSGKWLCHESCWTAASKISIESGKPVDTPCNGGLRLYSVPIRSNKIVIGAINFGYGDPPRNLKDLKQIAERYKVNENELVALANAYESRPPFIIRLAKQRLQSSARLIGSLVQSKQVEEDLRESEENLRATLNSIGDAVIATDKNGFVVRMNPIAEQLTGWSLDKAKGNHLNKVFNIINAKSGEATINPVELVLKDNNIVNLANDTLLISKDGIKYQIADSAAPVYDAGGKTTGVVLVFRDVTEKYHTQEALRKSEERLELGMVATNDGLWDWNLSTENVYFDNRYFTMAGYEPDEFPHTFNQWANHVHPDDIDKCTAAIDAHLSGKTEVFDVEFRFLRKDNNWMWIRGRGKIVERDENGKASRMVGTHVDISELKKVEIELAENNRLLLVLNEYTVGQSEVKTYDDLVELIIRQLSSITNAIVITFNEYNPDRKILINRNIHAEKNIINKAISLTGKHILGAEIPVTDKLYSEMTSSIVGFRSSLSEATMGVIPINVSRVIQKISGIKLFVGLVHIVEGQLYGTSMIGVKDEQELPPLDFLKSYAYISAISLRRLQAEDKIRYMGYHDKLTGLYNRNFLDEEMKRLDTKRQLPLSMIIADLNGLKLINDTYGHLVGDRVLKTAAEMITKSCRQEDIVARWGGDEFVILLPKTPVDKVGKICKRISDNCRNVCVENVPVSLAIGIATKTEHSTNISETLRKAEDNMYKQKLTETRSMKSAILKTLLKTLAEKSFETEAHVRRMQTIAQSIGKALNLPDTELNRLDLLITLHDIGKINISEEILTKKYSLSTESELKEIKKHPEMGFRIARATEDFAHVAEEILSHHERWDGKGYPRGLKNKQIPLLARITAIADAYEVMNNGRPYKNAMSKSEIIAEFRKCSGTQFDPELVKLFLEIIETEL